MSTKLHTVTDGNERPIRFFMTGGPVSDYTGAAALLVGLPATTRCWQTGVMTLIGSEKA